MALYKIKNGEKVIIKNWDEAIGEKIETDTLGWVEILDFEADKSWGTKVNFYLDKFHSDIFVASVKRFGSPNMPFDGGAVLIKKVEEEY